MAQKFIAFAVVVCLAAFVQSAPQFNRTPQQYQPQPHAQAQAHAHAPEPERQSRFLTVSDSFHQDPNGEYNFE